MRVSTWADKLLGAMIVLGYTAGELCHITHFTGHVINYPFIYAYSSLVKLSIELKHFDYDRISKETVIVSSQHGWRTVTIDFGNSYAKTTI